MFKDNLVRLRKLRRLTQEDVAEAAGVSRQAVAKWEAGETAPDLDRCKRLADLFGVSLDDLANYESGESEFDLGIPPRGKHIFGVVTVGEKGQVVIPARARKLFDIVPGDQLVVLGDEAQGLALIRADGFLNLAGAIQRSLREGKE